MFYVSAYLLPLALLLIAGGLWYWNVRAWHATQREETTDADLQFGRRQFQRRMQATGMLVLLCLGMCVGQLINRQRYPSVFVLFWFGMLLLLGWMVLLALGDLIVGRQRVARLVRERRIAEAQLQAELDRVRQKVAQDVDH